MNLVYKFEAIQPFTFEIYSLDEQKNKKVSYEGITTLWNIIR